MKIVKDREKERDKEREREKGMHAQAESPSLSLSLSLFLSLTGQTGRGKRSSFIHSVSQSACVIIILMIIRTESIYKSN